MSNGKYEDYENKESGFNPEYLPMKDESEENKTLDASETEENEKPKLSDEPAPTKESAYQDAEAEKLQLEQELTVLKNEMQEDSNSINKLREELGLTKDTGNSSATDSYFDKINEKKRATNEKIKELEKELLGVPEGEEKNTESIKSKVLKMGNSIESDEKDMRAKFVEEFTNENTAHILQHFKGFIDESKNATQARDFIIKKLSIEIAQKTKNFIETGEEIDDLAFEAEIKGAEFDNKDGETIKYVTEFNVEFQSGNTSDLEDATSDLEGDLLSKNENEALKHADENGDLEERSRQ